MQNSKSRSGSSPNSKQPAPKSIKGATFSPDSSDSKPSKVFERKPSMKSSSFTEKRVARAPEGQQQMLHLQEEIKKAKDELEELNNKKKKMQSTSNDRAEILETEVEKAKGSERKMLESLISQTKQLEQTKISLEEAKLEIRFLQESTESLKRSSLGTRNLDKHNQEEIGMIRNELKSATEAEEKSKKAMDGLAIALKEVSTEANQAKAQLLTTQSELENSRSKAEKFETLLKTTEEKLREVVGEYESLKLDSEELAAAWNEKEDGFINCMKVTEEENTKLQVENDKLIESLRTSREENSKLRDILKQAVNEATVVKEALEIARNENSQLKDALSEKENALQSIRQDYDSLKVSEAAAVDSVEELKGFLAATSTMDSASKTSNNEMKESNGMVRFPSGISRGESRIQNGRRHSVGGSGKFKGSVFDTDGPSIERKIFGSVSNASDLRVPSSVFTDDSETLNSDDFDHIDRNQLDGMGLPPKQKKKKQPILKRVGDLLRRSSFRK